MRFTCAIWSVGRFLHPDNEETRNDAKSQEALAIECLFSRQSYAAGVAADWLPFRVTIAFNRKESISLERAGAKEWVFLVQLICRHRKIERHEAKRLR